METKTIVGIIIALSGVGITIYDLRRVQNGKRRKWREEEENRDSAKWIPWEYKDIPVLGVIGGLIVVAYGLIMIFNS